MFLNLLLTEFKVRIVRYGPSFFPSIYGPGGKELLNRLTPPNPPDIPDLPINCEKPSRDESRKKNGKAAGADSIAARALKADMDTTVEILYPLFARIWEDEDLPAYWKEGHLILLIRLPKKGYLSKCSNYRAITLLSVPENVFNRVIMKRLKDTVIIIIIIIIIIIFIQGST